MRQIFIISDITLHKYHFIVRLHIAYNTCSWHYCAVDTLALLPPLPYPILPYLAHILPSLPHLASLLLQIYVFRPSGHGLKRKMVGNFFPSLFLFLFNINPITMPLETLDSGLVEKWKEYFSIRKCNNK